MRNAHTESQIRFNILEHPDIQQPDFYRNFVVLCLYRNLELVLGFQFAARLFVLIAWIFCLRRVIVLRGVAFSVLLP